MAVTFLRARPKMALLEKASGTLMFSGDLDMSQAAAVRQAFGRIAPCRSVIVDLARVTFIDSAGLGSLIGGIRRIREGGGEVVLCAPTHPVARVLHMTGVSRLAALTATADEAARLLLRQGRDARRPPSAPA